VISLVSGYDGLAPTEYITQVATTAAGHFGGTFAVLTSFNRLFLGALGLSFAVEMQSGQAVSAKVSLWFPLTEGSEHREGSSLDLSENTSPAMRTRLQLLEPAGSAPWLTVRAIAAANEIQQSKLFALAVGGASAITTPEFTCPYRLRSEHGDEELTKYIDMNDVLRLSLSLVTSVGSHNSLTVALSDRARLTVNSTLRVERMTGAPDAVIRTREVIVREAIPSVPYNGRLDRINHSVGHADVRVLPQDVTLYCEHVQTVTQVSVGCPPQRHVRVRLDLGQGDCGQSFGSGAFGTLAGDPTVSSLVDTTYTPVLYGCPISHYHEDTGLSVRLDLYDGDDFVREVTGDYIIWDARGRTDFLYSLSAKSAGCLREPMSWDEALAYARERAGYASSDELAPVDKDTAWTPELHRSCFDDSASTDAPPLRHGGAEYQLLNSSGLNVITFPKTAGSGLFLFKVRVVDPEYSYCELSTRFAVDVFGAPMQVSEILTIVFSTTAGLVGLLIASYFHYRAQITVKKEA